MYFTFVVVCSLGLGCLCGLCCTCVYFSLFCLVVFTFLLLYFNSFVVVFYYLFVVGLLLLVGGFMLVMIRGLPCCALVSWVCFVFSGLLLLYGIV